MLLAEGELHEVQETDRGYTNKNITEAIRIRSQYIMYMSCKHINPMAYACNNRNSLTDFFWTLPLNSYTVQMCCVKNVNEYEFILQYENEKRLTLLIL